MRARARGGEGKAKGDEVGPAGGWVETGRKPGLSKVSCFVCVRRNSRQRRSSSGLGGRARIWAKAREMNASGFFAEAARSFLERAWAWLSANSLLARASACWGMTLGLRK